MTNPQYALVWPQSLFQWEARRILGLPTSDNWVSMVGHLLHEAYHDEDVAKSFLNQFISEVATYGVPSAPSPEYQARQWLSALLSDTARLQEYRAPRYWAERHGQMLSSTHGNAFPQDLIKLIGSFQELGYFPKILPKDCVDEWPDPAVTRESIREATGLDLPWPITDADILSLDEAGLYSLIEFFHDKAARPRTTSYHSHNDCGLHYHEHDNVAGRAVYRWRVNALLAKHNVPLELGQTGEEQGRIVRKTESPLDDLAAEQVARRAAAPLDEVAHAIRMFRQKFASPTDKRTAITLLFGEMEPRRDAIEKKIASKDASDLFQIANKFTFRHRDKLQRGDYGDEFLDWIFWTNLAMVRLLDDLENKPHNGKAQDTN